MKTKTIYEVTVCGTAPNQHVAMADAQVRRYPKTVKIISARRPRFAWSSGPIATHGARAPLDAVDFSQADAKARFARDTQAEIEKLQARIIELQNLAAAAATLPNVDQGLFL